VINKSHFNKKRYNIHLRIQSLHTYKVLQQITHFNAYTHLMLTLI